MNQKILNYETYLRIVLCADVKRSEPLFINKNCQFCDCKLILSNVNLESEDYFDEVIWYDEWVCSICQDGIWFDHPRKIKSK